MCGTCAPTAPHTEGHSLHACCSKLCIQLRHRQGNNFKLQTISAGASLEMTATPRILLDHSPQSELGILGHGITLIQHNELERGAEHALRGCKVLNFLSNHSNTSIIRSIQLQSHPLHVLAIQLSGDGQHCRGLARSCMAPTLHVR